MSSEAPAQVATTAQPNPPATSKVRARVCVVIPNWNGAHLLPVCLASLRQQTFTDLAVVVVDNGSQDGSLALLQREHPEVLVVALPCNVGFAAGVNAGIRLAGGEYVALLNNDTEVTPDWLACAVEEMDRRPEFAFAASKLIDYEDRSVLDVVADGYGVFGVPFKIGRGERDEGQYETPFETFSACAGAALYRRSLFDDIGLFDEAWFAYVEDIEIGIRAQLAGHRCLAIPAARVYHIGTASTGGGPSALTVRLTARNVWWTLLKCMPASMLWLMVPATAAAQAGLVLRALVLGDPLWLRQNLGAYAIGLGEAARGLTAVLAKRRQVVRRVDTATLRARMRLAQTQRQESRARWRAQRAATASRGARA